MIVAGHARIHCSAPALSVLAPENPSIARRTMFQHQTQAHSSSSTCLQRVCMSHARPQSCSCLVKHLLIILHVLAGGAAAMKAAGYTPRMMRSQPPKQPALSAADAEAVWEDGSSSAPASVLSAPQDAAHSLPGPEDTGAASTAGRQAPDAEGGAGSYGMNRPPGSTSSPPGSTSQAASVSGPGSTETRQPYWRRQYIFCAATMPSGSGDRKDKSISKVGCNALCRMCLHASPQCVLLWDTSRRRLPDLTKASQTWSVHR